MNKNKWLIFSILSLFFTLFLTACGTNTHKNNPNYDSTNYLSGYHYAQIKIKDYGTIILSLDADSAPATVTNFVNLANEGFYDGLTFHRIINGFMIQGGDPKGNGTGGSTYTIPGEFSLNDYNNPISHVRGTISMARAKAYDSASSQFFIVQEDSIGLDGSYAGFGTVISGMDIVDAICTNIIPEDDNGTILSENQPVITSIKILPTDYFSNDAKEQQQVQPSGEISFTPVPSIENLKLDASLIIDENSNFYLISSTVDLLSISLYEATFTNGLNLQDSPCLALHSNLKANHLVSLQIDASKNDLNLLLVAEETTGALAQFLICYDSTTDSAYLVPIAN